MALSKWDRECTGAIGEEMPGQCPPRGPASLSHRYEKQDEGRGPLRNFTGKRGASGAAGGARPGFPREGGLAVSGELESGHVPRTQQPRSSDTHEKNQARVPKETRLGRSLYKYSEMASLLGTRDAPRPLLPGFAFLCFICAQ